VPFVVGRPSKVCSGTVAVFVAFARRVAEADAEVDVEVRSVEEADDKEAEDVVEVTDEL